jgi:Fe-S-cluster containining protein
MELKNFSENDRIFFSDGYQLAQEAIQNGFSNTTLFSAIEKLYEAIDGLNQSIVSYAEKQNLPIACHKGCHWCCHQAVFANSYELHYLAEKIKSVLSIEEIGQYKLLAQEKFQVTQHLNNAEILKYKSPCPLLKAGICSVYAYRPVACRIYLSTQLETCIEFYNHPEDDQNFPSLIEFPLRAGQMLNEGFRFALKEIGIQTSEFKIEEGLMIIFNHNFDVSGLLINPIE